MSSQTKHYFMLIGEHENQVSEGGEIHLHTHLSDCKKNPGHVEFIPIESFSVEHLPEGHQDIYIYDLIKASADLTCRLSVTLTSPGRPEFWPNTKIPYFLFEVRGKRIFRAATGMICDVREYTHEDKHGNFKTCPCDKCKVSDEPNKMWWKIFINTAAHVVYDDIEASHTTLRLFYDRENSDVITLNDNMRVEDVNIGKDKCQFSCVTCDVDLGRKLKKMKAHFMEVWSKVYNKYSKSRHVHRLNFIVSHPHGCSKQVSVGRWQDKVQVGQYANKFTYTTCTCPGSSGAYVHCVGHNDWYIEHVHSGSLKSGLNYSGVGSVWA